MRYPGASLARLENDPGIEIVARPDRTFDRAGDLADVDAMLTMWNPVQEGAVGPGMRTVLVAPGGVGYEDMAIDAMTRHGIAYSNVPRTFTQPVAFALLSLIMEPHGPVEGHGGATMRTGDA